MLTWFRSLVAEWSGMRQPDAEEEEEEEEDVTRSGASATGTPDADRTGRESTERTAPPGRDGRTQGQQLCLELPVSKAEVYREFGLQPPEFLVWVVEDNGGQMWQVDLVETTGWPKSTVSRHLCSVESDGTLERVEVGRRKLVCVPEGLPDIVSNDDWPDAPRV